MCIIFQVLCNDLANGLAGHKAPVRGIQEKIKNGRRSAWVFQSLSLNPRNYRLGKFLGMNNLLPGHIGYPSLWGRNNYFLQLQISALSARTQNEVKIIFIELFNNPTRALVCAELLCKGGCNRQLLSWLICWKSNWLPSHNGVTPRMGHPNLARLSDWLLVLPIFIHEWRLWQENQRAQYLRLRVSFFKPSVCCGLKRSKPPRPEHLDAELLLQRPAKAVLHLRAFIGMVSASRPTATCLI